MIIMSDDIIIEFYKYNYYSMMIPKRSKNVQTEGDILIWLNDVDSLCDW